MDRREFLQRTGAVLATTMVPATSGIEGAAAEAQSVAGTSTWLNSEATRIAWCHTVDSDVREDPKAVVETVAKLDVNCLVLTMGGSVAFYPTTVPFHRRAPSVIDSKDFIGGVVEAAKQRNIRLGARMDFSRQTQAALDAHPEWFCRRVDGSVAGDANGFTPCVIGEFYRTQAIAVISEVMDRYRPALVYVNNFVNPGGPCQCRSCEEAYQTKYRKSVPAQSNAEHQAFMREGADITSGVIRDTIRQKWPGTLFINADSDSSDGHHTEARGPGAPYASSEAVNRQRTSYSEKVGLNLSIGYGQTSRLVTMPPEQMRIHMYQAAAQGSPVALALTCTPNTVSDKRILNAMGELYRWHATNADLYTLQTNLARVLLLVEPGADPRRRGPSEQGNRGIYRMLTETHIPVAVSENPSVMRNASRNYDLVIVAEGAPTEGVREYVEAGGRALFVNSQPPFGMPTPVREEASVGVGYVEIRDSKAFPSLAGIRFITCCGGAGINTGPTGGAPGATSARTPRFVVYPDEKGASLTFVPPMVENPSEFAFRDRKQTDTPGLLVRTVGQGRIANIPWDLGGYYSRSSMPIHADLFADIVDALLPTGRQIRSDAHRSVEMVLMSQPDRRRAILHLINLSGYSENGCFDPLPTRAFEVDLKGSYSGARARVAGADLRVTKRDGRSVFTVPVLNAYEAIVLT